MKTKVPNAFPSILNLPLTPRGKIFCSIVKAEWMVLVTWEAFVPAGQFYSYIIETPQLPLVR